jgi:hypothetical protein
MSGQGPTRLASQMARQAHIGPGPLKAGQGAGMTTAELIGLLRDCLVLWEIAGQVRAEPDFVAVETAAGLYTIEAADPAMRPVRWFLQTPERRTAGRQPRAISSFVALLSALRNQLGGSGGDSPRVPSGGP